MAWLTCWGLNRAHICVRNPTLVILLAFGESAFAQAGGCVIFANFENRNRTVFYPPPINVECSWPHSIPYGNWGVDSNHGSRQDGDQYQGWKLSGGHRQWNSCYNDTPYTVQNTNQGNNQYASFLVGWVPGQPCYALNVEGYVVTSTGNYMRLYELDWPDPDDFVSRPDYPVPLRDRCSFGRFHG